MSADLVPAAGAWRPELKWAGLLMGMALGGFFDGILLHQILQWHHLLSGIEGQPWLDLRMQLLADGAFHALMYVVLAAGLALLFRSRHEFALDRANRYLLAGTVTGFGLWNVLDSLVFHWITQIHHVRMDAANPWLWDLAWFMVFGIGFLAVGHWLRQGTDKPGGTGNTLPGRSLRNGKTAAALALLVGAAAWQAARTPAAGNDAVVVFGPGVTPAQAFNAIGRINAQVVWADAKGAVWAIRLDQPDQAVALYRSGAWRVSHSALGLGCLSWSGPAGAAKS